jgi:predicted ribosome quality control (RQC) complex YloA/Tae2 family protein
LRRKEFTSFDVAAVVRELRELVLGSRVNNVYQLHGKALLFKLHKTGEPAFQLILEAGRRLHLTAYTLEKPAVPPAFCMGVRKYLRNARLKLVEQNEFERAVVFSFETKLGALNLVLELFGDGNIILTDANGRILQALIYKRMRHRNILRGELFRFAPPSGKNPVKLGWNEFIEGLATFKEVEVVRALARFLSVGGLYGEEILLRAAVDKTSPCETLSEKETRAVFDSLQDMVSQVTAGKLEPCVISDEDGDVVDATPLRLKRYEGFKLESYRSFNEALDEFYVKVLAVERATAGPKVEELRAEADRLGRIIENQEKVLADAESKAEKNRRVGDIIYAHIGDLQVLLDRFSTGKQRGKEWEMIVSEVLTEKRAGKKPSLFFESFDARQLVVNVHVNDLAFGLALRKTLFEDAAAFYERAKRERQRLEGAKAALVDSRSKLEKVETKMHEAEESETVRRSESLEELEKRKVRRKEWFEKFRWFVSSDGFLVVAGRDAVSNEVLIKKYTLVDDIVFHADVVGAPFVVVKKEGKSPTEQCLREAAEFAAAFSRGWRAGFGSVDVYWVEPEQLSKGGPSGESVGRGAFVVRGKRNWIRGVPLRAAVGVTVDEERGVARIIGGPVDAVKARAVFFVTVVPGDSTGKELFKRILGILSRKASKEVREVVSKMSVEKIREFVPYGKGSVSEE